jgi:Predicted membrane protein (DUF2306)
MSTRERSWPVPVALVALSAIPLTTGTLQLIQLAGGPALIPADHRFAGFPLPLVVHIVGATTYALVGILQLSPGFRRRHLAWHRRAGRVLAAAGLLGMLAADLVKRAGWVIDLAVAEWALRRPARSRPALLTGPQHAGALS